MHQNHFSNERIVQALRELFGLEISEGGIAAIIARAGKLASDCATEIHQAVTSCPIIKSDETSARVKGQNHWHWVFSPSLPSTTRLLHDKMPMSSLI